MGILPEFALFESVAAVWACAFWGIRGLFGVWQFLGRGGTLLQLT